MISRDRLATAMRELDFAANAVWRLGRALIAGWSHKGSTIQLCVADNFKVFALAEQFPALFDATRRVDEEALLDRCMELEVKPLRVEFGLPIGNGVDEVPPSVIDNLLRRYAVTRTEARAVMLFDIVGFSLASPIKQVAQLNALEYSINRANERLRALGLETELARSTVGDGFYVWNRNQGLQADIETYLALVLALADNARARALDTEGVIPAVRAVLSAGAHYAYHQVEGTSPRGFEYIVGDVTIVLARLIGKCLSGQVLVGDFRRPLDGVAAERGVDAPAFLARAAAVFEKLPPLRIGGHAVRGIRSYLTGGDPRSRDLTIDRHVIVDKHGLKHGAFNLHLQIALEDAEPVVLGLKKDQLAGFEAPAEPYRMDTETLTRMLRIKG